MYMMKMLILNQSEFFVYLKVRLSDVLSIQVHKALENEFLYYGFSLRMRFAVKNIQQQVFITWIVQEPPVHMCI